MFFFCLNNIKGIKIKSKNKIVYINAQSMSPPIAVNPVYRQSNIKHVSEDNELDELDEISHCPSEDHYSNNSEYKPNDKKSVT